MRKLHGQTNLSCFGESKLHYLIWTHQGPIFWARLIQFVPPRIIPQNLTLALTSNLSFAGLVSSCFQCKLCILTPATSMEQGPSWESNRSSGSLGIPPILWSPQFHYLIHKGRPAIYCMSLHVTSRKFHFNIILLSITWSYSLYQIKHISHCLCRTNRSLLVLVKCFVKLLIFLGEELLAPHPTMQLKKHPLVPVRDCYSLHCQLPAISGC